MGWLLILLASSSELSGVVGLKLFNENKLLKYLFLYVGGMGISLGLLYLSFSYLQVSIAYAVWVGIGTAGSVLINMIFFGESKTPSRLVSLTAIIIGVVGLKSVS